MSSSSAPIRLDAVSKSYPSWAGHGRTLRDTIARKPGRRSRGEQRWSLRDVSLSVAPGEMVGLIGGNGAGKSTLLRVASGLTRPTTGQAFLAPSSSSVLSLGETFAPQLTGEENAITAAIVAGFTPRQARDRVPAILAHAELEDAALEPVRTFSEGMKLRLAFSVMTQVRPVALLLDEVMSVGDISFQAKSRQWIANARTTGTSILAASHDLDQLATDADRVLWLEHGQVRELGDAEEVIAAYRNAMLDETYRRTSSDVSPDQPTRLGSREAAIEHITFPAAIETGGPLTVRWSLVAEGTLPRPPIVAVVIRDDHGTTLCSVTTERSGVLLPSSFERLDLSLSLERLDLVPGTYQIEIGAYRDDWQYAYDLHADGYDLEVRGSTVPHGVVSPPHTWSLT